jgi:hypothetical protein
MSMRLVGSLILGCACLALLAGHSQARVIEDWPYDKLFQHAELVVIVRPLSVRDATAKDKAARPPKECYLDGVVTTFKVLHVVKGKYNEKKLDLVHFKLKKGVRIRNGPLLVSFQTKEIDISSQFGARSAQNDDMLYLKNGKDTRLEFVSGQFDPVLSVKQLLRPFR